MSNMSVDAKFQTSATVCLRRSLFCDVTWRRMVVGYRRFGTAYRSHLQGLSGLRISLRMGLIAFCEISVNSNQTRRVSFRKRRLHACLFWKSSIAWDLVGQLHTHTHTHTHTHAPQTHTYTRTHTHTRTPHTLTLTHTHSRSHAHTLTHSRTHNSQAHHTHSQVIYTHTLTLTHSHTHSHIHTHSQLTHTHNSHTLTTHTHS